MKPLPIYIPVLISLFTILLPKRTAQACGFYVAPGEYRFWLLQPDITNQPDLTPFYFASGYLYRQDMNAAKETYIDENNEEWFREIKGKVSKNDIDTLLNATDPQYFFDEQKMLAKENRFLRFLQLPENSELYKYIILSKKVEQIAANPDPWEEDNFPNNNTSEVIREAHNLYKQVHLSFLKLRIAFQLTRLYAYNSQPKQVSGTYDSLIEPIKTNSWIKTAALYQKTFGNTMLLRNYWLSKVFDKGNYHKTKCLVRFATSLADSTLFLARNEHEKNVILAMKAFNYPGRSLHLLKRIYESEPGYKELPFLLLREVNKVEDWLVTNKVTDFGMPAVYLDTSDRYSYNYDYLNNAALNYKNDKMYAKELLSFIVKMVHDRANKQQALLHLYASHICMILKDNKAAAQHLQLAKAFPKKPRNVQTQIQINTYLLHLEDGFSKRTEDEFMQIMQSSAAKLAIYDPEIMKSQLVLYTARKMIAQKDRARGLMLLARTNRALGQITGLGYKDVYEEIEEKAIDSDYDQMLQILDKKKKSAFERFITLGGFRTPWETYYEEKEMAADENMSWSKNKLLDSKASWYIREHRLQEALVTMQQIPDSVWHKHPYKEYLGGDPFFLNIYEPHVHASADKRRLTKKLVVEQMIQLQLLAKKDKRKAAWCYYQLGNACYNMSWHGKSWLMVKRWWSVNEESSYRRRSEISATPFNDDYYGCRRAKEYYSRAMEATNDKKLSSLCYFMTAQCEQHYQYYRWLIKTNRHPDDEYMNTWKPDYKQAAGKGIDVSYYKSLVQECELYQSFIQQYNK
jgi:hypothetical protein